MFLSLVCDVSYGLHDKKKIPRVPTLDIFYAVERAELLPASEQDSSFRGKRETLGDQT